jgi:hypothetical protein
MKPVPLPVVPATVLSFVFATVVAAVAQTPPPPGLTITPLTNNLARLTITNSTLL